MPGVVECVSAGHGNGEAVLGHGEGDWGAGFLGGFWFGGGGFVRHKEGGEGDVGFVFRQDGGGG